ncbi:uncharacterized protein LOC141718430 [Apium graveolens]|uniref:uncharacterized protein LOC141718430 n=1 Tax=Apium graveolens TaxID=4045 RepID=UPI003D7B1CE5
MACNSTDEEEVTFPFFNSITDMKDPEFQLGMLFPNAKIFRAAVRKQTIMHRRPIKICGNYGIRVRFIYEKPCEWKIYASKMNSTNTYQIKVYNPKNTCTATFYQKQINSRWIAEHYEDEIRMNPTWPLAAFLKKVVNDWHCHVFVYAISRAKKKALDNINGKHVDQYGRVWEYGEQILKVMSQSTVQIMTEDQELTGGRKRFKRMYICLGPLKLGFKNGCRPLLGLDGCHLKGPYGGQLLAAVAIYANDGMYPLAWAVVEAENNDSWNWFLESLKSDMRIENDGGLINVLEAVFPNVEHRFCVMHLYRNMWKEHKGIGVRMYLWLAARATTDYTFNKHMQEMKNCQGSALNGLVKNLEVSGPGVHSGIFAGVTCLLITIVRAIDQSKGYHVTWSGGARYLVTMSAGGYEMVVDLEAHNYPCKKWGLSDIPCYHACACITWSKKPYEPLIHMSYSKDMFLKCYSNIVEPIVGDTEWTETPYPRPLPPEKKVQPGRPKKQRSKVNDIADASGTKLKTHNMKINSGEGGTTSAGGNVSNGTTNGAASGVSKRTIAEGTQGGVLLNKSRRAKVQKTPLHIEAQQTNVQGQGTTTTRAHIELLNGIFWYDAHSVLSPFA